MRSRHGDETRLGRLMPYARGERIACSLQDGNREAAKQPAGKHKTIPSTREEIRHFACGCAVIENCVPGKESARQAQTARTDRRRVILSFESICHTTPPCAQQ